MMANDIDFDKISALYNFDLHEPFLEQMIINCKSMGACIYKNLNEYRPVSKLWPIPQTKLANTARGIAAQVLVDYIYSLNHEIFAYTRYDYYEEGHYNNVLDMLAW